MPPATTAYSPPCSAEGCHPIYAAPGTFQLVNGDVAKPKTGGTDSNTQHPGGRGAHLPERAPQCALWPSPGAPARPGCRAPWPGWSISASPWGWWSHRCRGCQRCTRTAAGCHCCLPERPDGPQPAKVGIQFGLKPKPTCVPPLLS